MVSRSIHHQAVFSSCFIFILALLAPVLAYVSDTSDPGNGKTPTWNTTYTDLLKRDLLAHYDKFARPAQHTNITTVDVDMVFIHIDLDESKSLLTVNGWVRMMWEDEKLKWNKSDYGGLGKLHVADHEVWEPDIVLYNSAMGNNIDHYGNTHVLVFSDGRVLWVPPSRFAVFCNLDLTRWPFDRHTCMLKLGSWTYGGDMVDLVTNTSAPVELLLDSSTWKVISISKSRNVKYYKCCEEPYMDIQFDITIERDSSSYHALLFAPAIAVMLLCLSVFWIPANSGSKFIVEATTALVLSILLVYFSQRIVVMGTTTPLIVLYYAYSLILVAVSVLVSIFTFTMATKHNSRPVPWALSNIINSKFSAFLMLPTYKSWSASERGGEELTERSTLDEDREDLTSSSVVHTKRPPAPEWLIVATALDRMFFFFYCIIFLAFGIRCIL